MAIELGRAMAVQAPGPTARKEWRIGKGVSGPDRIVFIERLAMLLETGMPLHLALDTIARQTRNPSLAQAIEAIRDEVVSGKPFAGAIALQGSLFPVEYVSLVGAAESGGFLPEVLRQITEMEDRQERLTRALTGALTYPACIALLSVAVVVYVLVGVFPKFAELFETIRNQLPAPTLLLMAISDALRQYWFAMLLGVGAAFGAGWRWQRSPAGRAVLDHMKLRIPLLRDIFMQAYMARIMRVMGTSLGNRVSVLDTLRACRDAVANVAFRQFLARVEKNVVEGRGFASAFQAESAIPEMVRQMIMTGDQTGKLPLVMGRIADFYERELLRRIATLSRLAEPVMLLVMGVTVGLIVSALILPIFKLAGAMR